MVEYDEEIIANYANSLYNKAYNIIICHICIYAALGWLASHYLSPPHLKDILEIVIPACAGILGYGVGYNKSLSLKLRAQMALCQMEIERNTRSFFSKENSSIKNYPKLTSLFD